MRTVTGLFTLLTALALTGCASMNVSSHIEHNTNFTDYITFDWGPPDNLPVGDPRLDNNPFFNDFLQGAIEKQMASKGYDHNRGGTPDLLIHYHASVNQKLDVYEVDQSYGYCYGNCEPQVADYELGTLIVDIVDTKSNKVVWRGWAQDTINGVIDNQDRLGKKVDEAVTKMMVSLPNGRTAALR